MYSGATRTTAGEYSSTGDVDRFDSVLGSLNDWDECSSLPGRNRWLFDVDWDGERVLSLEMDKWGVVGVVKPLDGVSILGWSLIKGRRC